MRKNLQECNLKLPHAEFVDNWPPTYASYNATANKHSKLLVFNLGDLKCLLLRNEKFPLRRQNELMVRGYGPLNMIE